MNIIFHVGLHKTATTWLQSVLFRQHHQINLINDYNEPWNDEIVRYLVLQDRHSFDAEIYKKMIHNRIEAEFSSQKGVYLISAERLSGHPSSGGFDREKIIRNIHAAFPSAKILVTFRNQADLIRSTYQQMIREGDTQKQNIFLHREGWKRPFFDLKYFDLDSIYNLYSEIFSQNQLGFYCSEDLEENKERFILDLCQFIEVDPFFPVHSGRVNAGVGGNELEAIRILNHFRKSEFMPSPILNLKYGLIHRILVKIFTVLLFFRKTDTFSHDDIMQIRSYYSQTNFNFLSRLGSIRLTDPRYVTKK